MDYPELIADIGDGLDVNNKLAASTRHMGKVNCLWADGSVTSERPLNISPRLHPELWTPLIKTAKPEE